MYRGSNSPADLNFQSVSGLYKNFTRMSPSEFEFSINLIAEKISKKGLRVQESHFCSRKVGTDVLIDGSVRFFPQFFSRTLLSNFVKMHWVFWVPNYFFSFIRFDKLYETFVGPLHFTFTKTPKKPHSTADSHHSSRQKHQERKEVERSGWW